jgi:hypothetical protein
MDGRLSFGALVLATAVDALSDVDARFFFLSSACIAFSRTSHASSTTSFGPSSSVFDPTRRGADGTDERGDEGVFVFCIRVQPGNSTSPLCNISQASLST